MLNRPRSNHQTYKLNHVGNSPDQTTQRLKPIQCLFLDNKLFITCSAGTWYDPFSGLSEVIPGQLQMWDTESMILVD